MPLFACDEQVICQSKRVTFVPAQINMAIFMKDAIMSRLAQDNLYIPIKELIVSFFVIALFFIWQGSKGFNLWDEGFLWYGVQRVMLGEVPILDFMAYDPGRYYWSAAIMSVVGDNDILSLRASVAVFQVLGLFVGLWLISRSRKVAGKADIVFWLIAALTLMLWMFPRHKIFDISLSILLVGVLTYLISHPVPKRYFIAGILVGLVAVFGRNHGVYGVAGSVGVIAWLSIRNHSAPGFFKGGLLWAAGVVVGFLPVIFMALLIPGFATAFWESIRFLFEQQATNLPLPVPWPWTVEFATATVGEAVRGVLVGLFFVATLVFGGISVAWVIYRKLREKPVPPALVASAFLSLPYAHYAFSRADVGHLAQGIFPTLVGCLVVLSSVQSKARWPLVVALSTASIWVMYLFQPGWQSLASKDWVNVEVSGRNLQVDPDTASAIALLRQLDSQYSSGARSFVVVPFWPGAYALLDRKSPMWEIYPLFSRSAGFEEKEIKRIEESRPGFALVFDMALDGRDELRFRNTHPLTYQYIVDKFERIPDSSSPAYEIYKPKVAGQ